MPDDDRHDPLRVDEDREKLDHPDPETGPPVSKMATTYGSSFVTDADQADRLAADESDSGLGSDDGLGRPQPPGPGGRSG
jgi:hypothetical protein